jgi:xylulokinase
MSLMGLDVGTTGCKAVAFDRDGRLLVRAYREYPLINPAPGWLELDAEGVWRNVADAIREANAQLGSDPVESLSVTVLGEAITPVSADGRALSNSIVASDLRTCLQAEWWERTMGAGAIYAITGLPLHPQASINKVMWWRQEQPDLYERAWKCLCYGEFVSLKLGVEPVIDDTMAARTMAFDVHTRRWSPEILTRAGVDESKLARTAPSGTIIGEIPAARAADLGFGRGVKVVTGAHDQVCAAIGAGAISPGTANYTIGTVECISVALNQPNELLGADNYPCYPHAVPDKYFVLAGIWCGGVLLRWYRDTLAGDERRIAAETGEDAYDVIVRQVTDRPSNLFVVPHLTGTGSPFNDPLARGAIVGLSMGTRREDIVKAILEGVTFEMALNIKHLRQAGVEISALRAIGGGARSPTWLQIKADIMNMPVVALQESEATSLGAALLAGWATGRYASLQEGIAATVRVKQAFEPDKDRAAYYAERFAVYERLYPALKEINPLI